MMHARDVIRIYVIIQHYLENDRVGEDRSLLDECYSSSSYALDENMSFLQELFSR